MPMITLTRGQEESMYRIVGSLKKIADNLELINKQLDELNKAMANTQCKEMNNHDVLQFQKD